MPLIDAKMAVQFLDYVNYPECKFDKAVEIVDSKNRITIFLLRNYKCKPTVVIALKDLIDRIEITKQFILKTIPNIEQLPSVICSYGTYFEQSLLLCAQLNIKEIHMLNPVVEKVCEYNLNKQIRIYNYYLIQKDIFDNEVNKQQYEKLKMNKQIYFFFLHSIEEGLNGFKEVFLGKETKRNYSPKKINFEEEEMNSPFVNVFTFSVPLFSSEFGIDFDYNNTREEVIVKYCDIYGSNKKRIETDCNCFVERNDLFTLKIEYLVTSTLALEERIQFSKEGYFNSNSIFLKHVEQITQNMNIPGKLQLPVNGWNKRIHSQKVSLEEICERLTIICRNLQFKLGLRLYKVQILAVIRLVYQVLNRCLTNKNKGIVAEIKTGEGKSNIIAVGSVLLYSFGHCVDVVTTTIQLARREIETNKIFQLFNVEAGLLVDINQVKTFEERKMFGDNPMYSVKCFSKPIVYSTNSNFEFVFLYSLFERKDWRDERPYDVVIVDEVDNMFIDQTVNPAMISTNEYSCEGEMVLRKVLEEVSLNNNISTLTLKTVLKNQFEQCMYIENDDVDSLIKSAKTSLEFQNMKDYIVSENTETKKKEIIVLDSVNTGYPVVGSRFSNYIHEFIEIKNGIAMKPISYRQSCVTHNCFFSKYFQIVGVTGTIGCEKDEEEIINMFKVLIISIPRNFPSKMLAISNSKAQRNEILNEIESIQKKGRPILVFFKNYKELTEFENKCNIQHHKINGVDEESDKKIIESLLQPGQVIFSTNAAGRGTDFKLSNESLKNGGLHIIITFLQTNIRSEFQAIGRGGRQGNPGSFHIYCTEEEIVHREIINVMASHNRSIMSEQYNWLFSAMMSFVEYVQGIEWLYQKSGIELKLPVTPFGDPISVARTKIKEAKYPFPLKYEKYLELYSQIIVSFNDSEVDSVTLASLQGSLKTLIICSWGVFYERTINKIMNKQLRTFEEIRKEYLLFIENLQKYVPSKLQSIQQAFESVYLKVRGTILPKIEKHFGKDFAEKKKLKIEKIGPSNIVQGKTIGSELIKQETVFDISQKRIPISHLGVCNGLKIPSYEVYKFCLTAKKVGLIPLCRLSWRGFELGFMKPGKRKPIPELGFCDTSKNNVFVAQFHGNSFTNKLSARFAIKKCAKCLEEYKKKQNFDSTCDSFKRIMCSCLLGGLFNFVPPYYVEKSGIKLANDLLHCLLFNVDIQCFNKQKTLNCGNIRFDVIAEQSVGYSRKNAPITISVEDGMIKEVKISTKGVEAKKENDITKSIPSNLLVSIEKVGCKIGNGEITIKLLPFQMILEFSKEIEKELIQKSVFADDRFDFTVKSEIKVTIKITILPFPPLPGIVPVWLPNHETVLNYNRELLTAFRTLVDTILTPTLQFIKSFSKKGGDFVKENAVKIVVGGAIVACVVGAIVVVVTCPSAAPQVEQIIEPITKWIAQFC